jgi:hypothetical protein
MNKKNLIISSLIAVAVIGSIAVLSDSYVYNSAMVLLDVPSPYIPSDITKANVNVKPTAGEASFATTNISDVKDKVLFTIRGKVIEVGNPIQWIDNAGNTHGAIPVQIELIDSLKGNLKKGELFTVYIDSIFIDDQYWLSTYEPQFEIGEEVLIHIAKSEISLDDKEMFYVELGHYGKYQIKDGKAYNEKFPYGKSLVQAENEAR